MLNVIIEQSKTFYTVLMFTTDFFFFFIKSDMTASFATYINKATLPTKQEELDVLNSTREL